MSATQLTLEREKLPFHTPAAWFLPFTDAEMCLREICRWPVDQRQLRLFVVPRSVVDRSAAGLLVIPPAGAGAVETAAMPLGVLAGRLYLPIDARISPPLTTDELRQLCLFEVMLFHPVYGLTGFEEKSALRVWDLLERPSLDQDSWNAAQAGPAPAPRLVSIQIAMPETLEELFGRSDEEIGVEPNADLPPSPDEPGAAGKIARSVGLFLSASLAGAMKFLPSGQKNSWLERMRNWAGAKAQKLSRDLENLRHKELKRLLHLLESDPDAGLRHALPLNGSGNRGLVDDPGASLPSHGLDFSLGRLGGGWAADPWTVAAEFQQRLSAKYRELAQREMKVGRHRRAAYIFAELLGDFSSAAAALRQGKHFREAAVLYRDHLHSPVVAAECLAEGGLFAEAITLYESREMFLQAAHLYRKLGQESEASAAFRKAIGQRLRNHDSMEAARLLESELHCPGEALDVLEAGWRSDHQSAECLKEHFQLLGRMGLHERARALMQALRGEEFSAPRTGILIRILGGTARNYPDRDVRSAAADMARVKAAARLSQADEVECREIIKTLGNLVPEDRLFVRDGNRFISSKSTRAKAKPVRYTGGPELVSSFELPGRYRWHRIASSRICFFALGTSFDESGGSKLVLVRASWAGIAQGLSWELPPGSGSEFLFETDPERAAWVIAAVCGGAPLTEQSLSGSKPIQRFSIPAGTPGWLPQDTRGIAYRSSYLWLIRKQGGRYLLECRELRKGQLIATSESLELQYCHNGRVPLLMVADKKAVAIGAGELLIVGGNEGYPKVVDCGSNIVGLANAPLTAHSAAQSCVAVSLQSGVALYRFGSNDVYTVADDLSSPYAVFTGSGALVVAAGQEGRVYEVLSSGVRRVSQFRWNTPELVALVAGQEVDQFAAISSRGTVKLFKLT